MPSRVTLKHFALTSQVRREKIWTRRVSAVRRRLRLRNMSYFTCVSLRSCWGCARRTQRIRLTFCSTGLSTPAQPTVHSSIPLSHSLSAYCKLHRRITDPCLDLRRIFPLRSSSSNSGAAAFFLSAPRRARAHARQRPSSARPRPPPLRPMITRRKTAEDFPRPAPSASGRPPPCQGGTLCCASEFRWFREH